MRFHVTGLPWTETTDAYSWCAYTTKVKRFAQMMHARGHQVYLYAGPANEAPCTEHIVAAPVLGDIDFTPGTPMWAAFNGSVAAAMATRVQPGDFVCLSAGLCQQPLAELLPWATIVEPFIGYGGSFADYRVFESYAWMHTVYGHQQGTHSADGRFYDTVIPNYFDLAQFPEGDGDGGYYLYIGRLITRKGPQIAADVTRHLNARLIVAGDGPEPPDYGERVGIVGPDQRAELMGAATAVFVPTLYVEPFGGVAVEAMLCGTPVITTDFGAFTETVDHAVTGYRCHTLQDFVDAAVAAPGLNRSNIRERAQARFSLDAIGPQFEDYFRRLEGLTTGNWSTIRGSSITNDTVVT